MSNEAPETREQLAAWLIYSRHFVSDGDHADLVLRWLTTAREQGRAEALADVTEVEWFPWQCSIKGASLWKPVFNTILASRRRPVAAAGNEEIEGSGD